MTTRPAYDINSETVARDVQQGNYADAQKVIQESITSGGSLYPDIIRDFNNEHLPLPAAFGNGQLQIVNGTLEAVGADGQPMSGPLQTMLQNGSNTGSAASLFENSNDLIAIDTALKNHLPVDVVIPPGEQPQAQAYINSGIERNGGVGDAQIVVSTDPNVKLGDIRNGRVAIPYSFP